MTTDPIVLEPTAEVSFKIDAAALDELVKNHIDKYVYTEINMHVNGMAKRYINTQIEDAVSKNIGRIIATCLDEYTKATELNDQFYSEMNYKFARYIQDNQSTIFTKIIIQTYTEYLNKNPNIVKDLVTSFINSDSFQTIAKTMFYKRLVSRFNNYTVKVTDKLLRTLLTKPENQELINDVINEASKGIY